MIVTIKQIFEGSSDSFANVVYDYYIKAILESGKEIEIFDLNCFNLQDYIGKKVDCLLYPWLGKKISNFIIKGKFIGKVSLSSDWLEYNNKYLDLNGYYGIKTLDGIYVIDEIYTKKFELVSGIEVKFFTNRIDLLAWKPLK
ncbi:MAG: hypothetical protein P8Y97_14320 [Candidatus Lokiarchaeota archaeon]